MWSEQETDFLEITLITKRTGILFCTWLMAVSSKEHIEWGRRMDSLPLKEMGGKSGISIKMEGKIRIDLIKNFLYKF
jgi:hypothetical protein